VPILVESLQVSQFPVEETSLTSLSGQTVKLPPNSGTETSRMSIGGSGEGRKFAAPSNGDWYITAVWVYGSRYGDEKPPSTMFDIALSDADAKLISIWKGPYASFPFATQGDAWARFGVPSTHVPTNFYVTLNFRASASSGVYVAYDSSTKGNSIESLPGKPPHAFADGDWMIRVELEQKK
jgi:hypothetical protein